MRDLSIEFAGVTSPNPFWLASAPPTNTGDQIMRAFDHGWGGAVWKTLGEPIVNVSSRLAAYAYRGRRMAGLSNIELITDRSLADNLRELAETKRRYPKHAVIASLMVETKAQWKDFIKRAEDSGCDAIELNFGCPHGMCERGMGSAVGQEPRVLEEITGWAKEFARVPVIVKLTPNISDIREPGLAARRGGADAVSLINTIKSIMAVDLDRMVPLPTVGTQGTSGGFCGPAVKPIALFMVSQLAKHPDFGLPISAIGGVATWRDAVEFLLLGASSIQVCTSVMTYGYRIVDTLCEGLSDYMEDKGFERVSDIVGRALGNTTDWGSLDLNYKVRARVDADRCIGCQLCYVACSDGGHSAIELPGTAEHVRLSGRPATISDPRLARVPVVSEERCVGCNLCHLVCPAECIDMKVIETDLPSESWTERTAPGRAH